MEKIIQRVLENIKNKGLFIGKNILYFKETTSTQDIIKEKAYELEEGTVIIAQKQTKGRGRRGRMWVSMPGTLNFSLLLKPKIDQTKLTNFSLVAGVSIAEAITDSTGLNVSIKWPNDILIKNKKLCGILCETKKGKGNYTCLILGVGINVNTLYEDIPQDLKNTTTSLSIELNKEISLEILMTSIFSKLEKYYLLYMDGKITHILDRWKKLSNTLKKKVRIESKNHNFEGVAEDISIDGSLIVKKDDGKIIRLTSADVTVRFE